jgi:hypothetical protein
VNFTVQKKALIKTCYQFSRKYEKYLICHIISTDEDLGLRIESFAVINLHGVSTNKTIKCEYGCRP